MWRPQGIGLEGENLACRYLEDRGYEIVFRNFKRSCGEIDIIARIKGSYVFTEVKSVLVNSFKLQKGEKGIDEFRPEDNVHLHKLKKIARTGEVFMTERGLEGIDWRIDVVSVKIEKEKRNYKIAHLEDVIL